MKIISPYAVFFAALFLFGTVSVQADQTLITPAENAWLDSHHRTITIHPQEAVPPYVFAGSGSAKEIKGFSVEYMQVIAKKLGITITFTPAAPLDQLLASAKERADGVILSLSPTSEREQYLYFTESFYSTPAVIAVRKDFTSKKNVITLADFTNKKVAVGDKYAVQSYIQANYPGIDIVSVIDDQVGLQRLLLGDVDAMVMDFGSLSYYTTNDVLSYVKVVGRTGFEYEHSIAIPKSSPELVLILNKGLQSISNAERQVLINKWMNIEIPEQDKSSIVQPVENTNLKLWFIFIGFLILITATIVIVLILRRRPRVAPYRSSLVASEVQDELEELKLARETLKDDMAQIAELEKDIEEKMEGIRK